MLSNMFFALVVPRNPTDTSLFQYLGKRHIPKGITACELFCSVVRKGRTWHVRFFTKKAKLFYCEAKKKKGLRKILNSKKIREFGRIAFVVRQKDFQEFAAVAREACGQFSSCVYEDSLVKAA